MTMLLIVPEPDGEDIFKPADHACSTSHHITSRMHVIHFAPYAGHMACMQLHDSSCYNMSTLNGSSGTAYTKSKH
eukprot:scaffold76431_cov22-Prasinocladus_malaysianus.AAC.2